MSIAGKCHCVLCEARRAVDVVPVVTSRIDERLYAVASVNAFEGVEPSRLRAAHGLAVRRAAQ